MKLKTLIVLATLTVLQAACGGEQPVATTSGADDARPAPTAARAEPEAAQAEAEAERSAASPEPAAARQRETVQIAQADAEEGAAAASRFRAGQHYETISPVQPTSTGPEQVEVAEFFMYSCIHCYNFDPFLEEWDANNAEYINFIRVPVVWNDLARLHARAYYTAEALGLQEDMHGDFFREIHVSGNLLQSADALAEFFGRYGVSRDDFERTFNSFAVHAKVQRADELMRRYRISATPTMVVDGKYRANASNVGGYDELIELMDALAAQENEGN